MGFDSVGNYSATLVLWGTALFTLRDGPQSGRPILPASWAHLEQIYLMPASDVLLEQNLLYDPPGFSAAWNAAASSAGAIWGGGG